MNGFIGLLFTSYAAFRLCKPKGHLTSSGHHYTEQLFNLLILLQILTCVDTISSPGTDFLSMLLILYLFSKWAQDSTQMPFLFLTAVFGATVKLSIAAMVMLGIPLLLSILYGRRWKQLLFCIAAVCYLALPFFIRNVLISGYLLYPSTFLDFFHVDWKMPAYSVTFDNHEIIAWGRRLNDVDRYAEPLTVWVPVWFHTMTLLQKALFVGHLLFLPAAVVCCIRELRSRHLSDYFGMYLISILGLLMWFFSAPLIRYGNVYLYLLPAILLGHLLEKLPSGKQVFSCIFALSAGILLILIPASHLPSFPVIRLHNPSDYNSFTCDTYEMAPGISIYYPIDIPECTGYQTFPSTPYPRRFEVIELRGTSLEEGFRVKPELQGKKITTYGDILD